MSISTLTATIRNEKVNKTRKEGYTPAVIYGKSVESTPIKIDTSSILKVLKEHGDRARIKLNMDDKVKIGIIKSVDIDTLTSQIQHLDIQIIEENEVVNWEIPILFTGRESLESKRLLLHVYFPQIKVTGNANKIPDFIQIDISDKEDDATLTIADLNLTDGIEPEKTPDTVVAIIKKR
ncbi:MAG: 50S ribosomal protein L25 [Peptostreptococcales bacterium]|jgi:large subunit ribosomal protein L25